MDCTFSPAEIILSMFLVPASILLLIINVTCTFPEIKSAGCHPGTLGEFVYSQNKMAPYGDCSKYHPGFDFMGKIATIMC